MTPADFRRLALKLPDAVEGGHMGHPDFRIGKKIFATLGYPNDEWAMVKLTPEQQEALVTEHPKMFAPVGGKWGLRGATHVILGAAKAKEVSLALAAARQNLLDAAAKPKSTPARKRK